MTTEKKEVSASPDTAEAIAAQVSAAQEPAPATGEPPAPAAEPAQGVTLADIENYFKSYEGRQANWNAQKMKEIEANISSKLETVVSPLLERQRAEEIARVEQLDPEDQVAYWKQKATTPAPEPSAPTAQQPQGQDTYSAEDRLTIINSTTQMLVSEGLNVPYTDDRLWAGATNGMTPAQLVEVARTNAQRLKAPASPPPATAPPTATPPPSTQDAPASSTNTYGSRTEASAALLSGEIKDIDEFQRIGQEEGWLKKR